MNDEVKKAVDLLHTVAGKLTERANEAKENMNDDVKNYLAAATAIVLSVADSLEAIETKN